METNVRSYIVELLQKLIQKTKVKEVKWQKTSRSNQYMLKIDSGAFMIELNRFLFGTEYPDSVKFKILNEIGDEIQILEQSNSMFKSQLSTIAKVFQGQSENEITLIVLDKLLVELYKEAESNASGIMSSSLKKMIEELDSFTQSTVR